MLALVLHYNNFILLKKSMSKGLFWKLFILLIALAGTGVFLLVYKTGYTITQISADSDTTPGIVYGGRDDGGQVQLPIAEEVEPITPTEYPGRITFLLLGIRGKMIHGADCSQMLSCLRVWTRIRLRYHFFRFHGIYS